jgi:hypothetical protein
MLLFWMLQLDENWKFYLNLNFEGGNKNIKEKEQEIKRKRKNISWAQNHRSRPIFILIPHGTLMHWRQQMGPPSQSPCYGRSVWSPPGGALGSVTATLFLPLLSTRARWSASNLFLARWLPFTNVGPALSELSPLSQRPYVDFAPRRTRTVERPREI